jgi:hypothetical protein
MDLKDNAWKWSYGRAAASRATSFGDGVYSLAIALKPADVPKTETTTQTETKTEPGKSDKG